MLTATWCVPSNHRFSSDATRHQLVVCLVYFDDQNTTGVKWIPPLQITQIPRESRSPPVHPSRVTSTSAVKSPSRTSLLTDLVPTSDAPHTARPMNEH